MLKLVEKEKDVFETENFDREMFEITNGREPKVMYVHAGAFHADDCMCIVLGAKYLGFNVFKRINSLDNVILKEGDIVADIGLKYDGQTYFDHHQPEVPTWCREYGLPEHKHSACSLLFNKIAGEQWIPDGICQNLRNIVQEIAIHDNGEQYIGTWKFVAKMNSIPNGFEKAIMLMSFYAEKDLDKDTFMQNLKIDWFEYFYKQEQEIAHTKGLGIQRCCKKDIVGKIVFCETFVEDSILNENKNLLYKVFPSNRGGFNIMPIADGFGKTRKLRILLPENLTETAEGCSFEHAARFLAAFDSIENIKKAFDC